jgi:hypothetical protein
MWSLPLSAGAVAETSGGSAARAAASAARCWMRVEMARSIRRLMSGTCGAEFFGACFEDLLQLVHADVVCPVFRQPSRALHRCPFSRRASGLAPSLRTAQAAPGGGSRAGSDGGHRQHPTLTGLSHRFLTTRPAVDGRVPARLCRQPRVAPWVRERAVRRARPAPRTRPAERKAGAWGGWAARLRSGQPPPAAHASPVIPTEPRDPYLLPRRVATAVMGGRGWLRAWSSRGPASDGCRDRGGVGGSRGA